MIFRTARRCFNIDIMMLYISATDHDRKRKFSSYVHLPPINKMFQYRYTGFYSVQCRTGYYFPAWVLYFSFGTCWEANVKQLCSSSMYKNNL